MKGTYLDFLTLALENPDLARELAELATRHGFEFTDDELSETQLEAAAGGSERPQYQSNFESANQKSTQYFNMLTSMLKAQREMQSAVTRNLL